MYFRINERSPTVLLQRFPRKHYTTRSSVLDNFEIAYYQLENIDKTVSADMNERELCMYTIM